MKNNQQKVLGEKRRDLILQWLKESKEPITASVLADKTNVSRQVIVQDISLLKAREEPIMATSQGYIYIDQSNEDRGFRRIIVCCHQPEDTLEELNIIVDHGVMVKDVTVEHPVYGEITAPLVLGSRRDVQLFLEKVRSTNAALLSELTDGIHLHTIEAETTDQLDEVCSALDRAGYLLTK